MKKFTVFFIDGQSVTIESEHWWSDDNYAYFYNGEEFQGKSIHCKNDRTNVALFLLQNIAGVSEDISIVG